MYVVFEYATLLALIAVATTVLFLGSTALLAAQQGIAAVVRTSRKTTRTGSR